MMRTAPPRRVALLSAAVAALAVVRLCLRVAPGRVLRLGASASGRQMFWRKPVDVRFDRVADICGAVSAVGTRLPLRASCLEQSVAAVVLLAIAGIDAQLVVGVARDDPGFRAHAWVECGGSIVLGAGPARGMTPLELFPSLDARPVSSCPG